MQNKRFQGGPVAQISPIDVPIRVVQLNQQIANSVFAEFLRSTVSLLEPLFVDADFLCHPL